MNISIKMTKAENARHFGVNVDTFVTLDIEEYLRDVVPCETDPAAFPMEALKAQAIAARTFALYKSKHEPNNLTDTSGSAQTYRFGSRESLSDTAIQQTSGMVLGYSGDYILAQFSRSNGGRTIAVEGCPYMIEQDDPWTRASGAKKEGHGHGLSQMGMKYAAENQKTYRQILMFYYDNVHICYDYDVSSTLSGELLDDYPRSEYVDDADYNSAHLDFGTRTLKYVSGNMMRGEDIRNVQTRLAYLSFFSNNAVNGVYDKATMEAIKKFQKYNGPFLGGLTYDGIAGAKTKKALRHPPID